MNEEDYWRIKELEKENRYLKDKIRQIAFLCDQSYVEPDEVYNDVFDIVNRDELKIIAGYLLEHD